MVRIKNPFNSTLSFILYLIIRIIGFTWFIKIDNPFNSPTPKNAKDKKIIFAFWHNRIAVMTYFYRNCNITAMISQSRDGELIAKTAKLLGHNAVRGSSTRNSKQALDEAIELLKQNKNLAITPDGPQGPKYKLKAGIIDMAKKTGALIIPMSYKSTRNYVFSSWDNFILPKPFSKITISFGKPIKVPKKLSSEDFELIKNKTENIMKKLA